MTDKTCRYPSCSNPVGEQDRSDYQTRRYCSVQCQTKYEHVQADARDAVRDPEPELAPGRQP